MVGLWPCKLSSKVHINGQCVSELVREDKGEATVPESKDEKDPKRTRMVFSKGHKVVRSGYSRLPGYAARVVERGGESGTLTELVGFARNMTRIGGQIGLLRTARVTGMDTRVGRQTRLLRIAGVTRTAAQVSRQIRILRSAGVTETATQSQKTPAGLTGLATQSRKQEVPIGLLTQKVGL
jgi:hypothetical protein